MRLRYAGHHCLGFITLDAIFLCIVLQKESRVLRSLLIDIEISGYCYVEAPNFCTCAGETKRKFESVYTGGTLTTVGGGEIIEYWHCCGVKDPFDPGCEAAPHISYDD